MFVRAGGEFLSGIMPLCENKDAFVSDKTSQLFTKGPGREDKDVLNYRSYHYVSV